MGSAWGFSGKSELLNPAIKYCLGFLRERKLITFEAAIESIYNFLESLPVPEK